jgi:hypothetical protein
VSCFFASAATLDVHCPLQSKWRVSSWSWADEEMVKGCHWRSPNFGMHRKTHCPADGLCLDLRTEKATTGARCSSPPWQSRMLACLLLVRAANTPKRLTGPPHAELDKGYVYTTSVRHFNQSRQRDSCQNWCKWNVHCKSSLTNNQQAHS